MDLRLGPDRERRRLVPGLHWAACCACLLLLATGARAAQPFIWDDDGDRLDDRMESVEVLGYRFSFENGDTLARQRIVVLPGSTLLYGVYVSYTNPVTAADLAALTALGMPVRWRYTALPAVRSVATFAQASAARLLPGVERVEAIPILYPVMREDAASAGVRDPSGAVWPTWSGSGGANGEGIVVGVLDSGVNDQPSGGYPGHESLIGRVIGGGSFIHADSTLDTPRSDSTNPEDALPASGTSHGTHVAGVVLGSGGSSGYAAGIATGAKLVDVQVLTGSGLGFGVAEGLDWCIHNRARDWGAGSAYLGIDVLNLSLSSLDASDGQDFPARLAARAVQLGIVVVASMGNEGATGFVPSPAAGDGVIAVGAYDAARTGVASDDAFWIHSSRGPRVSDGDVDQFDELKPDLVAPGVAVLSADGDRSSSGEGYVRESGTSMSTAIVTGAVACLRSEAPALSPVAITDLLRRTARRNLAGVPPSAPGADPRWNAGIGFGALDLYAARLEMLEVQRTQFRRMQVRADHARVDVEIWTQRERGASQVVLERALDDNGAPGVFIALDSLTASGDSSLALTDLHPYSFEVAVTPADAGLTWWLRAATNENGVRHVSAARTVVIPTGPPVARIELTIVHNAIDTDVSAVLEAGSGAISIPVPGSAAALSSDWVSGASALGNVAWTFAIDVPAGAASTWLPPSGALPWRLEVTDGGFVNRLGRVTDCRLVWFSPSGPVTFAAWPLPLPTVEGATVSALIPSPLAGVPDARVQPGLRLAPNPVHAGGAVQLRLPDASASEMHVFDPGGRQVGRMALTTEGANRVGTWEARDASGQPLPAGLYFVRAGERLARLAVLRR